ncbi:cytochrome c oxidase subunit II [Phreatobacter stygius]|uniref:Cytochrome c oxidase subunit 2 n=1 Tax=Phreatobacter stygius TaxID=1940610 RepID=A0A4D7BCH5_9HYPH|nr:cytochrome c oxidase subunit II [Phreatobacter stygius]QCI65732.1 cytochrome c oxidase subunit II [Phreatobacter stygius]
MREAMRNGASAGRGGAMALLGAVALLGALGPAMAQTPGLGQPELGGINFQVAASPIMEFIHWFHNAFLLPIIVIICVFVAGLLLWCCFRFSEKRNPVASKTTHHVGLEVAWTVIPVFILIIIAVPSFRLLYQQLTIPRSDLTVKAIASTWKWSYEYPDNGNFSFVSTMQSEQEIAERVARGTPRSEVPRLLAVDNEVVVPVNKIIRVQVTSSDVIHAFALPSFGVKIDAVPGRLNETWFHATREGIFYGQCSELCGKDHAFMPIAFRVVSEQAFAAWLEEAKKKFAAADQPTAVAAATAIPAAR